MRGLASLSFLLHGTRLLETIDGLDRRIGDDLGDILLLQPDKVRLARYQGSMKPGQRLRNITRRRLATEAREVRSLENSRNDD